MQHDFAAAWLGNSWKIKKNTVIYRGINQRPRGYLGAERVVT
jgi:hypothetical protein